MFVDNVCRTYLTEGPVANRLGYETKVFSFKTREKFLDYLDLIRDNISEEHLASAQEVYGQDGTAPFLNMFHFEP